MPPTFEVWSLDRYESARIVAETREEAVAQYSEPRMSSHIYAAAHGIVKQYSATTLEYEDAYVDWRIKQ